MASDCQRFANESPEPNANKRHQSSSDWSGFTCFSRERDSLITVKEERDSPPNAGEDFEFHKGAFP
jgi:hypothetical protein